jgi:hypothetical protein
MNMWYSPLLYLLPSFYYCAIIIDTHSTFMACYYRDLLYHPPTSVSLMDSQQSGAGVGERESQGENHRFPLLSWLFTRYHDACLSPLPKITAHHWHGHSFLSSLFSHNVIHTWTNVQQFVVTSIAGTVRVKWDRNINYGASHRILWLRASWRHTLTRTKTRPGGGSRSCETHSQDTQTTHLQMQACKWGSASSGRSSCLFFGHRFLNPSDMSSVKSFEMHHMQTVLCLRPVAASQHAPIQCDKC